MFKRLELLGVGLLLALGHAAMAQDTTPAAPPVTEPAPAQQTTTPAPAPAETVPATTTAPPAETMPVTTPATMPGDQATPAAPAVAPADQAAPAGVKPVSAPVEAKGKKEKAVYTGPTEIIVLPATPMLDEEGRQLLDPDAKPMFNAPVKQQRDKFGHPLFDEKGKPVFQTKDELGYDEHGKKIHAERVKPPKLTPVTIAGGTYTVDGVIGKAALNYDIADLKYIYLYVPGIGVTVISNEAFPGAKEQPNAFSDKTLTVVVGEHTLQLASDKPLMKEKKPVSAFVLVDRDTTLPSRFPVMGYGTLRKPPYAWPGSKPGTMRTGALQPPPPPSLRPTLALSPCPSGQMRQPGPAVLPGQVAPEQPCVPISKAMQDKPATAPAVSGTTGATGSTAVPPQK